MKHCFNAVRLNRENIQENGFYRTQTPYSTLGHAAMRRNETAGPAVLIFQKGLSPSAGVVPLDVTY